LTCCVGGPRTKPEQAAYTFLIDGENEAVHLTYAELDQQARAIAGWLQQQGSAGQGVLLPYPPGLDFIAAFYGCLYAGVVACRSIRPTAGKRWRNWPPFSPMPRLRFC